jgi:hypothetical protein
LSSRVSSKTAPRVISAQHRVTLQLHRAAIFQLPAWTHRAVILALSVPAHRAKISLRLAKISVLLLAHVQR